MPARIIQISCGAFLLAALVVVTPWVAIQEVSHIWVAFSGPARVGPVVAGFGKALAYGVTEATLKATELRHLARLNEATEVLTGRAVRRVEQVQTSIENLGSRIKIEIVFKVEKGRTPGSLFSHE